MAALLVAGISLAACGSGTVTTSSAAVTSTVVATIPSTTMTSTTLAGTVPETTTVTTTPLASLDTGDILGFELDIVSVGGEPLVVAVADDRALRQRGLMGVTDFGDVDGMLFEFELPTLGGFWMKDTLVPLDIAFFDEEGGLVQIMTMTPCVTDDCPSYTPDGAYRWALERPAGTLLGSPTDLILVR